MRTQSPLRHLRSIKSDLEFRSWALTLFEFQFKGLDYVVFILLYTENETKPQYALVKMRFIDAIDADRSLECPANSSGLIGIDARTLREFFRIEWTANLGDILRHFTEVLGDSIPERAPSDLPPRLKYAAVRQLSLCDGENPSRLYCLGVRRNPARQNGSPGQRTLVNSQKTFLLRPALYEALAGDPNISFLYSDDPAREQGDARIFRNFARGRVFP